MANSNDSNSNTTANNDAAAPNKPNEEPQQANSPRRNPNNQDQDAVITPEPMPRGSSAGTEFGGSSTMVTAAAAADPVPLGTNIGGSGAVVDLTPDDEESKSEGSMKKLAKTEDGTEGQSSCMPVPKRARAEMDAPPSEPMCSICSRRFYSWKAVFRHLRTHPEREWRGAFPPPPEGRAERDENALQIQLAPTLLNVARETLDKMNEDPNPSLGAAGPSTAIQERGRFDLNARPIDSGASGSSGSSSSSIASSSSDGFDLNKPPSPPPPRGS
ncbi:unnamed protein product [Dovyalis caffra]|uniref:C2H2-type domain-containing protein n=1 Tax=Dovyalis caffra TaxID=77055 RepID=A0AAV1SS56_9ROSI|nr:unnamed protein product [Dovyalis caffra]